MSTAAIEQPPMYKWQDIPWRDVERKVFKLQRRIYQASRQGKQITVRKLQKLLLSSWHARCLAVRKVTQDNRGRRTPGVDGKLVISPTQRIRLASRLKLTAKAHRYTAFGLINQARKKSGPWEFRRLRIERNKHWQN